MITLKSSLCLRSQVATAFLLLLLSSGAVASPEIVFTTYLGGSRNEQPAGDMFIDDNGYIYITGSTKSADFPVTRGAFDTTFNDTTGHSDAFVSKLDPDGVIIWSTFIGTPTRDEFYTVKVDDEGYVYLAGAFGPGAPTTPGVLQRKFSSTALPDNKWDGYIAKLKPDGSGLVWATYLGTRASESLRSMDMDADGSLVVATKYAGEDWPQEWFTGGYQSTPRGGVDTVIIKISNDGRRVLWASYLGGSGDESSAPNVCLDQSGRAHVLTSTRSADMPTTADAHDRSYNGGKDIHVATLSPDGRELLMGTYLGTTADEGGGGKRGIQTDQDGNLIVSGHTHSSRFPVTPGAYRGIPLSFTPWGATGVTAKFSPAGRLLGATYIGSSEGVSLDSHGNVYIAFEIWEDVLPSRSGAFQSEWGGKSDGVLAVLSADLRRLLYATYLGGSMEDGARITATGKDDSIHVSLETRSADLPAVHTGGAEHAGAKDIFLVKFSPLDDSPDRGE
jgi:hypothetical protein